MYMFIKCVCGRRVTIEVDPIDTIKTVKLKIYKAKEIPPQDQRLIYGTTQLDDGE